ncbi:MAG: type II secretion system minor pseudopilin GspJ [Desulfobia sp.]
MKDQGSGFTLLEVLVALAIFAVLSLLAYNGIKSMITSKQHITKEADQLAALQLAITRLSRDLEFAVDRPVCNEFGEERPAFVSRSHLEEELELTRSGWRNPADHQRSSLQRVAYRLMEGKLLRDSRPVSDQAYGQQQEPFSQELLDQVNNLEARFLDHSENWHNRWPPANSHSRTLPRAVKITLELEDWGEVNRLLVLTD